MKLLHVSSSYPLSPGDHTAPFMEEMLVALVGSGHDVTVVVPRVGDLEEGVRNGVRVVGIQYAPASLQTWGYGRSLDENGKLKKSALAVTPVAVAGMTLAVRRELKTFRPDVVHLHWALPQGVIGLALPDYVPIVVSIHGADAKFMAGRLKAIAGQVLRRADWIVAASSGVLDVAARIEPAVIDKSSVIPHGADASLFMAQNRETARKSLGVAPEAKVVLGVGRLVKKKGFAQLLRAGQMLHDVEVVILGEGPERHNLEVLGPSASLPGAANREEVAMWMAAADVVAIPSVTAHGDVDSGPVVLMEAMAAGRPVVATPIGMAPDVIVDGVNGHLVDSPDPDDLAEALTSAIANRESFGSQAEATFTRIGDWSRVADSLGGVYSEVLASRRSAPTT